MKIYELAKELGVTSKEIQKFLHKNSHLCIVDEKEEEAIRKEFTGKMSFYRLDRIDKEDATYSMIIGERSNGKSFAVLERILNRYLEDGSQGAIIRRWDTDFKGGLGQEIYSGVVNAGKLKNTPWDGIEYKSNKFILYRWDDDLDRKIYDRQPFAYAFSLTQMEHTKSTSYDNVKTILFDEFLTRNSYLPDEFVLFMNIISTIVRYRDDVKIYMCANTVNKSAPYFSEMGIKHIDKIAQGTIEVYSYGDSRLKVAVEYCKPSVKSKPSNKYFAFDNPKLQMITGGAWEVAVYPHLPMKYKPKDVRFRYYIIWEEEILEAEVVRIDRTMFTFVHRKTTPIKDEDKDLIFTPMCDPRKNWRRRISVPQDDMGKKIWQFYTEDRVYYQDNDVGEIVRNYLQFSQTSSIIKS